MLNEYFSDAGLTEKIKLEMKKGFLEMTLTKEWLILDRYNTVFSRKEKRETQNIPHKNDL